MRSIEPDFLTKLKWSLPWLSHYPLWRAGTTLRSFAEIRKKPREGSE